MVFANFDHREVVIVGCNSYQSVQNQSKPISKCPCQPLDMSMPRQTCPKIKKGCNPLSSNILSLPYSHSFKHVVLRRASHYVKSPRNVPYSILQTPHRRSGKSGWTDDNRPTWVCN